MHYKASFTSISTATQVVSGQTRQGIASNCTNRSGTDLLCKGVQINVEKSRVYVNLIIPNSKIPLTFHRWLFRIVRWKPNILGCCCLYQKANKCNGGEAHYVLSRSSKRNMNDEL